MTSLTQASITARKSIRFGIYGIIFLILARMTLNLGISVYKKIFPPAPEPANVAFGKLPKIQFPENSKPNLKFTAETVDGGIPQFPYKSNVYFMPKKTANLLSLDFARDNAKRMGFDSEPQIVSDSIYRFNHRSSAATLEYNIVSGSFSVSFDLNADPAPLSLKPPQPEVATATVRSFLSSAGLLASDLSGPAEHTFLKPQAGSFVTALSLSDSTLIRVDLFRKNYNDLPVLTARPKIGNIWFMVSGVREKGKDIIAGEYHYYPVDESKFATYPTKSGETAWQELNSGKYYLASSGSTQEGDEIKIRKIYLAYYDSGEYTGYLQPIYVFEGDKDFVGYLPALTDDSYSE